MYPHLPRSFLVEIPSHILCLNYLASIVPIGTTVQAALDPGVGKGEVRAMEREIHRMRIRLDGLKREQVWHKGTSGKVQPSSTV